MAFTPPPNDPRYRANQTRVRVPTSISDMTRPPAQGSGRSGRSQSSPPRFGMGPPVPDLRLNSPDDPNVIKYKQQLEAQNGNAGSLAAENARLRNLVEFYKMLGSGGQTGASPTTGVVGGGPTAPGGGTGGLGGRDPAAAALKDRQDRTRKKNAGAFVDESDEPELISDMAYMNARFPPGTRTNAVPANPPGPSPTWGVPQLHGPPSDMGGPGGADPAILFQQFMAYLANGGVPANPLAGIYSALPGSVKPNPLSPSDYQQLPPAFPFLNEATSPSTWLLAGKQLKSELGF